ncbi:MAG: S1C family serine protease [Planctomycetales bacterium]
MSQLDRPYRPRSASGTGVNWLLVILLILMAGFLWRGQGSRSAMSPLHDPAASERTVEARGDLAADERSTIELFKRASPSVVHIMNLEVTRDRRDLDALGHPRGSGSGFVWDQSGYIVTNFHVIEGADALKVTLADQSMWDARFVGTAVDKDIAVLKIEAPADLLHPISLGQSDNLEVGQKVFAIGNPFGLDQTLTTGIISGLGREILSVTKRPIQGVIQTDAAVNPGNSGGPLLDSSGLVIGVNTAIFSPSGVSAGIGYAVPVDPIRWIVPQLIKHGKVERIGMGVSIWEDYIPARLGMKGVLVRGVAEGFPAEKAGIRPTQFEGSRPTKPGDLIVAVNGKPVRNSIDLFRILDQYKAGETVQVRVARDREELEIPVTLQVLE